METPRSSKPLVATHAGNVVGVGVVLVGTRGSLTVSVNVTRKTNAIF